MKRRGVSLIEALLSLLLIGLALAAIAAVVRSAAAVSAFSSGKDSSLQAAQMALLRMRDESLEATSWLAPTASTSAAELRFLRLAPDPAGRLPVPPTPAPLTWDPLDPAFQVEVRWFLEAGALKRQLGPSAEVVARDVTGLDTRFLPGGNLEMTLSASEKSRTVQWKLESSSARSR